MMLAGSVVFGGAGHARARFSYTSQARSIEVHAVAGSFADSQVLTATDLAAFSGMEGHGPACKARRWVCSR